MTKQIGIVDVPAFAARAAGRKAATITLTLRLTKDDVTDVTSSGIKFRDVQPGNGYQINCPLVTPDAIDLAVDLTQRALDKVRSHEKS